MPDIKVIRIVIKGDDKDLDRSEKRIGAFGGNVQRVAGAMKATGAALTAGITMPLLGTAVASVKAAGEFEQSMNVLAFATHASKSEISQLSQKALQLGADLTLPNTSAKDAAEAMLELAKGGLSVKEAMEAARGTLQLSAAAQISNAKSGEIVVNALKAFGLHGREAARVADILANAEVGTSASVLEMANAFKSGATAAQMSKLKIDEYVGALSLMAEAGIKGANAGTTLKSMLLHLIAPGKEGKTAMDALGFSVFDTAGKIKPLVQIVEELNGKFKGMSDADALPLKKMLFGSYGLNAGETLLRKGSEELEKYIKLVNTQGTAAGMAAAKNAGLLGAIDGLKSTVETLMIKHGTPFLKFLTDLTKRFSESLDTVNNISPGMVNIGVVFGLIAAALGPLLLGLGNLIGLVGTIASAWPAILAIVEGLAGGFAGFAAVLTGPVGLAIAAIVALVAGLALAWRNNWGHIREVTQSVTEEIRNFFAENFGWIKGWLDQNMPMIRQIWSGAMEFLRGVTKAVLADIQRAWDFWGRDVVAALGGAWDIIKAIVSGALKHVLLSIQLFLQVITGDWRGAFDTLKKIVQNQFDTIGKILWGAVRVVGGIMTAFVKALIDPIINLPERMKIYGKNIIDGLIQGISGGKSEVAGAISAVAEGAIYAAQSTLGIHSPSRVFREIGMQTAEGFALGLTQGSKNVFVAAGLMFRGLVDQAKREREIFESELRPLRRQLVDLMHGEDSPEMMLFENPGLGNLGAIRLSKELARMKIQIEQLKGSLRTTNDRDLEASMPGLPGVSNAGMANPMGIHATGAGLVDAILPENIIHQRLEDMRGYFRATFAGIFQDTLERGGNLFDNLQQGFSQMLRRMVAQYITSQLFGAVIGGGPGPLGALLGGIFGGARANGGPVHPGRAYLVGERGPEIFMPGGSGQIIPNGAGGGSSTVVNLHGDINNLGGLQDLMDEITDAVQSGLRYG
jgi:TP901 family phage tail tape measure protein